MIAVALRTLRHRPGGFVATFLSAFLGATLLMAFASLLDTAAGADPASAESLPTTAAAVPARRASGRRSGSRCSRRNCCGW